MKQAALIKLQTVLLLLFLTACADPPTVKSFNVQRTDLEATVSSVNSGVVRSEKIAELAFGAVGRVKKLNVALGDIVEKDFIIAEIENDDMLSGLKTTMRELERQQILLQKKLSSAALVDQAQTALEMAQGAYDKTLIKAPFRGMIAELNMEVGQLSQITTELRQALVRIVDLEPRYIRAEIDEVDMPRVRSGQPARVKILAVSKQPFEATVRKVVPFVSSVREQDRTAEIELSLNTTELLPVGASGDVEIIVEKRAAVIAAPLKAISSSAGRKYAYKFENGMAKRVELLLGISNFDMAEIKSGLNEGDIILMQNDSVELKDNLKVVVE